MDILQKGNYVTVDDKGRRTSVPMDKKPTSRQGAKRPAPPVGGINPRNAEAKRAAGMKKGGEVRGYGAARKPMKKGGACR